MKAFYSILDIVVAGSAGSFSLDYSFSNFFQIFQQNTSKITQNPLNITQNEDYIN